ncbi:hypothetical protein [Streptomyces boncukensis]|uniref:Uncharacterized protein n=1 Tax=Streptomyces boncukensis TaxID=2711219 RepID=A0A6G4WUP7_9ACTN|nr:hypothetical protein [Streptomyces boncukensis]NGO68723.1 hypothetical protein [Streptomyces boncukensis]
MSTAKRVGIIVGVLVVVVGGVVGGLLGAGAFSGGDDDARYRLTGPGKVAGEYTRKGEAKEGTSGRVFTEGKGSGKEIPGLKADGDVTARYASGSTRQLQLGGAYGEVDDPGASAEWLLKEMRGQFSSIGEPQGDPEEFTPSGFDGDVLKCQAYAIETVRMRVCVWGDSSTVGAVSLAETSEKAKATLAEAAELTAKVRSDARVKR